MRLPKNRSLSTANAIKDLLVCGASALPHKHFPAAALDAEILLAHVLKKPKEYLYTYPEKVLSRSARNRFKELIEKRVLHTPIAYITHAKEFYGLDFYVDARVLIPRGDTEALVEKALGFITASGRGKSEKNAAIIDIGTGSGCIIIAVVKTLAKEGYNLARMRFIATDISKKTLAVAKKNARRHGVEKYITFYEGNLLEPIMTTIESRSKTQEVRNIVILANLPYITPSLYKTLVPDIRRYEPKTALLTPNKNPRYYYKKLDIQVEQLKKTGAHVHTFYELSNAS